ncbi:TPA: helix-turn-helix transcriptional regulator [Clostridioides difficile]|uniref:helix-turn-helix domain-containing protein n=1 Tax=Clostridioides difficile TaxID=1496 RepID=UPI00038D183E|nr:helix-turn-helix transcriptional regulator [Clostridioides difficile]EQH19465.1 helix-turn-helix family protein [Clostridioides difficile DA00212]MBH7114913.1 helix-turn-helix transcriptional regulator [Clostridioides difficile]HBF5907899.1 helix-turn-helix transcriptional regulator [Clostridioides difficile]HBF6291679.1 helix-turn-helix transcriptional regulator [Clostridioides difficile]HBY2690478.1 helix-turn-helix transcriptional regulator [Clostridioides difficile]
MLRQLRKMRHLTQLELAEKINYNKSYISKLEKGNYKNVTVTTIVDLAIGLEVNYLIVAAIFIIEELKRRKEKNRLVKY